MRPSSSMRAISQGLLRSGKYLKYPWETIRFFIAHGQFNGCLNGNQPGTFISQLYFQQGFIRIRYDSSESTVPHQEHGKTNGVTIVSLPSPKQWPMINNDGF